MSIPDGTRAWRKGWRKRWREGSSFRTLSPLARCLVIWVEDNADDAGQVTTTMRHLAKVMGCKDARLSPSRGSIWRAIREAKKAEILRTTCGQDGGEEAGKLPTTITRVNFKEYQEAPEEKRAEKRADLEKEAGLSSRREQKKAEKEKTTTAEAVGPQEHGEWRALVEAINNSWTQKHGAKLVWLGKDWKPLRALLDALGADEVIRRWLNYLANGEKFYAGHPLGLFMSQVNRFAVGQVEASRREPWEGESPTAPGSEAWPAPTPAQLAEWEAQAKAELRSRREHA